MMCKEGGRMSRQLTRHAGLMLLVVEEVWGVEAGLSRIRA
jgi:hypothetical protein